MTIHVINPNTAPYFTIADLPKLSVALGTKT